MHSARPATGLFGRTNISYTSRRRDQPKSGVEQAPLIVTWESGMAGDRKPRVYLIGTGGSISFVGRERTDYINYSYDNKHLTIQ